MNIKHIILLLLFAAVVSNQVIVGTQENNGFIKKAHAKYQIFKKDITQWLLSKKLRINEQQKLRVQQIGLTVVVIILATIVGGSVWKLIKQDAKELIKRDEEQAPGGIKEVRNVIEPPKSILKKPEDQNDGGECTLVKRTVSFEEPVGESIIWRLNPEKWPASSQDLKLMMQQLREMSPEQQNAIEQLINIYRLRERRMDENDRERIENMLNKLYDAEKAFVTQFAEAWICMHKALQAEPEVYLLENVHEPKSLCINYRKARYGQVISAKKTFMQKENGERKKDIASLVQQFDALQSSIEEPSRQCIQNVIDSLGNTDAKGQNEETLAVAYAQASTYMSALEEKSDNQKDDVKKKTMMPRS